MSERNPMQPIVMINNVVRFKENKIVRYLLDNGGIDLNRIASVAQFSKDEFSQDDFTQFAQLIGYSVDGFHELSYVSDADALLATATAKAKFGIEVGCRVTGCEIHCGVRRF